MKRWKAILGIALIFLAGVLVGSLGAMQFFKFRPPFHRFTTEERTQSIMKRLDRKLDLTEKQWDQMIPIVRRTQEEVGQVFKDNGKLLHGWMERDMQEFKKVLNTDQQKKLEELRQEFEKKRLEHEKAEEKD